MNRTLTALTASLLLATGCSNEPSYDQAAERCIKAVNALPKGAQLHDARPKPCERMTDEDYNLIHAHKTLTDAGLMPTPTPTP
ncbi:hypothetical protein OG592_27170 [Streptomyces avidinii]|uniref:hypothetical protein n=1 Tax=Streptomyces avidinii TaxID=1895 RepID=UPI003869195C|nr:hypothetical protein OG592_27170 [Streptomyces avidinii]